MFRQFLCWLKTKHKHKRIIGTEKYYIPYHYYPDGKVRANDVDMYVIYECKDCRYKGHQFFKQYRELPF
jgi:hypothetical protein